MMTKAAAFLLLAGFAAAFGQNQPPVNYGASLTEGTQLENRRYSARLADIQKEVVDVQAEYANEIILCKDDGSCREHATRKNRDRMDRISIERNNEAATHQKNLIDIARHWAA